MGYLRVLFNTEGNKYLGMGHVYECIRLGNKFRERYNPEILYLLSHGSEPGIKKIKETDYKSKIVKRNDFDAYIKEIKNFNPNVVINDILYIEEDYLKRLRSLDVLIVSMEHIQKTPNHTYADIIFNSLYPQSKNIKGKYYFGPHYVSLPDSFRDLPKKEINEDCKNFFICFGGSDTKGFTLKAIEALNNLNGVNAIALLGPSFAYHEEVDELIKKVDKDKFTILNNVSNILPYMLNSDIGLVSGGHTLNELAATGTPGMMFCHNDMEVGRAKLFADYYKMCINMGDIGNLTPDELLFRIQGFIKNFQLRKKISENGQRLQDGKGSDRIIDIIMENLK